MANIETEIKRLNLEMSIDLHCDIKKYAASRNMSIKEYVTTILFDQIMKEKHNEQNR